MRTEIRWGVIGCGYIAKRFATALQQDKNAKLVAFASSHSGRAKEYAHEFGASHYYENYDELLSRSDIDVVYVANCTSQHVSSVKACLRNNKAVLCEKPMAVTADEAIELTELAKKHNLFLMEAMWMRFFPAILKARELVLQGEIGELRMLKADFGFKTTGDELGRHLNSALGGGAILDVGVYPLHLAAIFLGQPMQISSTAYIGATGVDEASAYLFGYENGQIALLSSAINLATPQDAILIGTTGRISIPDFWCAQEVKLQSNEGVMSTFCFPHECNGFEYEIREVQSCLVNDQLESKQMPWQASIDIATMVDSLRGYWSSQPFLTVKGTCENSLRSKL